MGGRVGIKKTSKVYSSVEELDLATKRWSKMRDLNKARYNVGLAAHENMLYVFGGCNDDGNPLKTCERYVYTQIETAGTFLHFS